MKRTIEAQERAPMDWRVASRSFSCLEGVGIDGQPYYTVIDAMMFQCGRGLATGRYIAVRHSDR